MATLPSNYDRYDDSPPWWGGDQIWNKMLGGACTSGFAVVDPGGQDAVLTASHCGPPASIDDISDWCGSQGTTCQDTGSKLGQVEYYWGWYDGTCLG